jgi:hypothetical protein
LRVVVRITRLRGGSLGRCILGSILHRIVNNVCEVNWVPVLVAHPIAWNILSISVKSFGCNSFGADIQKFIVFSAPSFVVN